MQSRKKLEEEASAAGIKPWEAQPGESEAAYSAFCDYLGMPEGKRTFQEVARKRGCGPPVITQWANRWKWNVRCSAYQSRMIEVTRAKAEFLAAERAVDWAKRQAEIREREHKVAIEGLALLSRWVTEMAGCKKLLGKMKTSDAAKLLDVCSRVARLSAGMATNRDEISGLDGEPIKVEVLAAIAKVYGPAVEALEVVCGDSRTPEVGNPITEERAHGQG